MEKPILFNTEMVKSILEGRKTVTRRITKMDLSQLDTDDLDKNYLYLEDEYGESHHLLEYAPYQIGDILWIRETWSSYKVKKPAKAIPEDFKDIAYIYKADGVENSDGSKIKWHPSIHMPKSVARIFLKVTDVRVERLQEITENDVLREGFRDYFDIDTDVFYPSGHNFKTLWDSTVNKKDLDMYGWDSNCWVWVVEFERVEK